MKLLSILLVSFIGMNCFAQNDSSGFYATIGERKGFLLYNSGEVVPNCETKDPAGFKCAEKCCQKDDCALNISALPRLTFDCQSNYNNSQNQISTNNNNPPVGIVDPTNSNNNNDQNIRYLAARRIEPFTAISRKNCINSAPGMILMYAEQTNGERAVACALNKFVEDDRLFNITSCAVDPYRIQNIKCTYKAQY